MAKKVMSKRKNGEGSWRTVQMNGYTYKRFRSAEGKDFYGATENEVKEKYKIWKKSQKTNLIDKKSTVYQTGTIWLGSLKKHIKASTYDGYEHFVEVVLGKDSKRGFGQMQILNVRRQHIQSFIDSLADSYSKSSVKKFKSLLGQVFKYAKAQGILSFNPFEEIKLPVDDFYAKPTKEHVFLSTEDRIKLENEEKRLYSNGKRVYGNNAKAIVFLMHTGLRFGELTALKWKNVDLKNKVIHIEENSPIIKNRNEKVSGKYVLDKTSPKSRAGKREIALNKTALGIIEYFYDNYSHDKGDSVFVNENGKEMGRRNANRTLSGMLKAAHCELQDVSLHDLRHSFGSELIKQGQNIKVVSELLGHGSISVTYNIYIHILPEQKAAAVESLVV